MRLDYRDKFPSGMEEYLSQNGWHFNKKMCDWAVSRMYKRQGQNKEYIQPYTKDNIDNLMRVYGIKLENSNGYDYVYVMNMAKADFLGSSIRDEQHLVKYVKDYIDDPDGYDGLPFTRFYADCIGSGTVISWEDML